MKYASVAILLLLNSEVLSLIALTVMVFMAIADLFMAASKEGKFF